MEWIALWFFCGIISALIASSRGRRGCRRLGLYSVTCKPSRTRQNRPGATISCFRESTPSGKAIVQISPTGTLRNCLDVHAPAFPEIIRGRRTVPARCPLDPAHIQPGQANDGRESPRESHIRPVPQVDRPSAAESWHIRPARSAGIFFEGQPSRFSFRPLP